MRRRGLTEDDFRRIALGFDGAIEGAHMGHPDFRAFGRIFATLHPDRKSGMVKLTPDQQQEVLRTHPAAFSPEAGAWGRSGCTRVALAVVDEETLGEAMTFAWRNLSKAPKVAKAPKAKRSKVAKGAKATKVARTHSRRG
jgi:hypothetical protein